MPSAKILAQKQAELDVLVGKLKNANAGVLVDYSGITVEQDTKLRASFRKSGVEYIVQPGGSIRDDNVIETANKYGITMAFTGMRLFHH